MRTEVEGSKCDAQGAIAYHAARVQHHLGQPASDFHSHQRPIVLEQWDELELPLEGRFDPARDAPKQDGRRTFRVVPTGRGNCWYSAATEPTLYDVWRCMTENGIGLVPIVDHRSRPIAVISLTDFFRRVTLLDRPDFRTTPAMQFCTHEPQVIDQSGLISAGVQGMLEGRRRHYLVVDEEGRLTQVVSMQDTMDALLRGIMHLTLQAGRMNLSQIREQGLYWLDGYLGIGQGQNLKATRDETIEKLLFTPVGDLSPKKPVIVNLGDSITKVYEEIRDGAPCGVVAVLDDERKLVGYISERTFLATLPFLHGNGDFTSWKVVNYFSHFHRRRGAKETEPIMALSVTTATEVIRALAAMHDPESTTQWALHHVFIVDGNGYPTGVLDLRDFTRVLCPTGH